jgi:hypothetical protein
LLADGNMPRSAEVAVGKVLKYVMDGTVKSTEANIVYPVIVPNFPKSNSFKLF